MDNFQWNFYTKKENTPVNFRIEFFPQSERKGQKSFSSFNQV